MFFDGSFLLERNFVDFGEHCHDRVVLPIRKAEGERGDIATLLVKSVEATSLGDVSITIQRDDLVGIWNTLDGGRCHDDSRADLAK
jgi:hypothetical protein